MTMIQTMQSQNIFDIIFVFSLFVAFAMGFSKGGQR